MQNIYSIKTVFLFFLNAILKKRRTKFFIFLSFIPAIIIFITKLTANGNSDLHYSLLFNKIALIFFFGFFIQVLSLLSGTSVINDEINDKTLIYLTTKPISKTSILIGKFLASFIISISIMTVGIIISYIFALTNHNFDFIELISFFGVAILSIFSYTSLFMFFGTVLKRPIIVGLIFSFGWEPITKFIGGNLTNFSLAFYINKLLPGNILEYSSSPSSIVSSSVTLLVYSIIFIILSVIIFSKKEYILSDAS